MRPPFADAIFWVAVACCVVAQVAILRSTFAVGQDRTDAPATLRPVHRGLELTWGIVPAVGLVLVLALTWRAVHARPAAAAPHDHPAPTVAPRT